MDGNRIQTEETRLFWLDGLKGLACMGVYVHHFGMTFFSSSFFGTEHPSVLWGIDTFLSDSPLSVVINGNFWVCLFLMISAFLFASRTMRTEDSMLRGKVRTMLLRRYPRLMLPAFIAAVLNFVLIHILDLLNLNYAQKSASYGLKGLLSHGLIRTWISPDSTLLGPYWTLYYLLFGCFLAVLLSICVNRTDRLAPLILLLCVIPFALMDPYFASVVLGVLAADLSVNRSLADLSGDLSVWKFRILCGCLVLAGLFLGGYPSYVRPQNVYRIFAAVSSHYDVFYIWIHSAGAFLLLTGLVILHGRHPKGFLASRPFLFLGRLAYPIYLLHVLWIEFAGYPLIDRLTSLAGDRGIACILTFAVITPLLILSALLFDRTAGAWCERVVRNIR